jgi:site-specific DNA-methyltransferase (adenine-specific)
MREGIGRNDVMAYLVMMTVRLLELHRVLKDTGSLYLHCDPTASHYLKLVLDQVFGARNFRNEIIWCYTGAGQTPRHFPRKHDTILWYSKGKDYIFNKESLRVPYKKSNIAAGRTSYTGRKSEEILLALDKRGKIVEDWWSDVATLGYAHKQVLGYPTQKPERLLERIIRASSNEGDVVLDPFCGCGTAVAGAQKLGRKWIGIDITYLAINVMKKRLWDSFGIEPEVIGEPKDLASVRALAQQRKPDGRYQFQWWALSLIGATPFGEKKKGADKGIDGIITFIDEHGGKAKRVVVSVKSGHISVKDIRELEATVGKYEMGIFITLEPPTKPMIEEAVSAGYYHSPGYARDYPKVQLITIEELLEGKKPALPPLRVEFLPKAPKFSKKQGEQMTL